MKTIGLQMANHAAGALKISGRGLALFLFAGALGLSSLQARADFFTDDFTYGQPLNARWVSQNSSNNPTGTDLTIVNWLGGVLQSSGKINLYNHIQTPIDATGKFTVDSVIRENAVSSWAPSLMVYWDTSHWIRFGQFDQFALMYNDGNGDVNTNSAKACGGWSFFKQRIEFGADKIKFYASSSESDTNLVYLPELDLPRGAWSKAPGALLIVGKGYQGFGNNNPDFNNDYIDPGGDGFVALDFVAYLPIIPPKGTVIKIR